MVFQGKYIAQAFICTGLFFICFAFFSKIQRSKKNIQSEEAVNNNSSIPPKKTIAQIGSMEQGKLLYQFNCAACHKLTGTDNLLPMTGFESRDPWKDRQKVYDWIRDPAEFIKTDSYTRELKEKYGVSMPGSPHLSNKDIDNIIEYINIHE